VTRVGAGQLEDQGTPALAVRDLGRLAYAAALAVQQQTHEAVLSGHNPPTLLLVEHDPVITVSQRQGAGQHLLASPQRLAELGIALETTDRGGDITYHGPGQLVAYPIVRLADLGLNVGRYMRLLEQVVIDTVGAWGIEGRRIEGRTGVWVGPAKLCAMGVRVRRNVSLHGLALNVSTDLAHFQTIVPCGLADATVTSLQRLLGPRCPDMDQVKAALIVQARRWLAKPVDRAALPPK
jgi:lipoyl(octanoyl) transferase